MNAMFDSFDDPELSSSCDPELRELMRRIDVMMNNQKKEFEAERSQWDVQQKSAQREIQTLGSIIKRRDREMEILRKQLQDSQMSRQETVSTYEPQLQRLKGELDKLKRSYHKLQRKTLKDTSGVKNGDFIKLLPADGDQSSSVDHQRLLHEAAVMKQLLLAKDQVIHSLEDSLSAQGDAGVETLRKELETTVSELQRSRSSEEFLKAQIEHLKERLSGHVDYSQMEVKRLKAKCDSPVTQIQRSSESSVKKTSHVSELTSLDKDEEDVTSGSSTDPRLPPQDGIQVQVEPPRAASQQSSSGDEVLSEDSRPQSSSSSSSSTARSHISLVSASNQSSEGSPAPSLHHHITLPPTPGDVGASSPAHTTVKRFLEEESLRCNELQHKLDLHIQGMRENDYRTQTKYLTRTPGPTHTLAH